MLPGAVVGELEIAAAAQTLAGAFHDDPVWGWVFSDPGPRHAQQVAFWTLFLEGSIEHRWVWMTPSSEAVALWIPPGYPDLTEPFAHQLEPLVHELVGDRADLLFEVLECFEAARPDEPHFYLSLLGTHPEQRGHGYGMQLLRDNLGLVDAAAAPAYLESTNPINVARYESVGFEVTGEFKLPLDGPDVTTMWRHAR